MGYAKKRRLQQLVVFEGLDEQFKADGVDTTAFGFYDSDAFLAKERAEPTYLENYAKWVVFRPRTSSYEARVCLIIPKLAELVGNALSASGMQGSCVAASGMISRMLDRLHIWSFGVAGSLTLEVESQNLWRGLASIDDPDFPGAAIGHAWVVAPPFMVVDSTITLQHWQQDPIREYVPPFFVGTDGTIVKPSVDDVVSAKVQSKFEARGRHSPDLHYTLEPRLREFGRTFPTRQYQCGDLTLRYVPAAIRQTDCPLEAINTKGGIGRPAIDIWNEIYPQLTHLL